MLNFSWLSSAFYFKKFSLHLHPHYGSQFHQPTCCCKWGGGTCPHYGALFSMTSKAQYRTSFMVFLCVLFGTHWLCTLDWAEGFWSMMIWWWWTLEHWSFFMSLTIQFLVPPTPSSSFLNIQRQTKAINAIWPMVTDHQWMWPRQSRQGRSGESGLVCHWDIVINPLWYWYIALANLWWHCVIVTFSLWIENGWARRGGPPVIPTKLNLLTVPRFGWICFSPAF